MPSTGEPKNLTELQTEALKEILKMGICWYNNFSGFDKDGISHPRTPVGAIGQAFLPRP